MLGSHPGHPKSTQNGSRGGPGRSPEHPGPSRVDGEVFRTLPESAKDDQKSLPRAPGTSQDHSQRPLRVTLARKKTRTWSVFTSKKVPFWFSIVFSSFFCSGEAQRSGTHPGEPTKNTTCFLPKNTYFLKTMIFLFSTEIFSPTLSDI